MNDALPDVQAWLERHEVGWVCAVSPHLDDAGFSIATFLAQPGLPAREVWTVFSATTADGDVAYAKAMGFAGPLEEFEARRDEDHEAMRLLGVPYRHLGVVAATFRNDPAAARVATRSIVEAIRLETSKRGGKSLVLLPAGAGVEPTTAMRAWRRLTRSPVGCRPHAEHEGVRDALAAALDDDASCLVGYYAEVPYLWSEGPQKLESRLKTMVRRPLQSFAAAPRVDFKLAVARAYRSQVVSEFGARPSFQRRSLAAAEWLYLPA